MFNFIKKQFLPAESVQALVSIFYTPPTDDDDPRSSLEVLLLPGNNVLEEVNRRRRKFNGEEIYIDTPPCELIPNQEYTLSTSPQDDSIIIHPFMATFEVDESSHHNYMPTFVVNLEERFRRVRLLLRDSNTSVCVWEHNVDLSAPALRKQQVQHTLSVPAKDILFDVRRSFIDNVSDPILNKLLDRLLQKKVIIREEYDTASVKLVTQDKARSVIDTVMSKGTAASSLMIPILCEVAPFLSKYLGLFSMSTNEDRKLDVKKQNKEEEEASSSSSVRTQSKRTKKHFVDQHWSVLSEKVTNVLPILYLLHDEGVISPEDYDTVRSKPNTQDMMRELYTLLNSRKAKDIFFKGLEEHEESLVDELKDRKLDVKKRIKEEEEDSGWEASSSSSVSTQSKRRKPEELHHSLISTPAAHQDPENQSFHQPVAPQTSFSPMVHTEYTTNEYRFKFPEAGRFQCRKTGLAFGTTGEGEVLYRTVQWDEEQLQSKGGTPAGPLFDIQCPQQSICQLHLPHCDVTPGDDLWVANITDEGMHLLKPLKVTQTHVIVNVSHLSLWGLVWIRNFFFNPKEIVGQVLLFLRPPSERHEMNVFLLPRNVPPEEVKVQHQQDVRIMNAPTCSLTADTSYSLHCPPHKVQPKAGRYYLGFEKNYQPTFMVFMDLNTEYVSLAVRGPEDELVWEGEELRVKGQIEPTRMNLSHSVSDMERINTILDELEDDEFKRFQRLLRDPANLDGQDPIGRALLQNKDRMETADLIVQKYLDNVHQIMVNVLGKVGRKDLQEQFLSPWPVFVKYKAPRALYFGCISQPLDHGLFCCIVPIVVCFSVVAFSLLLPSFIL